MTRQDPMAEDDIPLTGAVKDKLIRTKERWAEEGRLLGKACKACKG